VGQAGQANDSGKTSRGVLTPGTLIAAVLMVGVGFAGAWIADRYILKGSAEQAADGAADAGAALPIRDVGASRDAALADQMTWDSGTTGEAVAVPSAPGADVGGSPEAAGGDDIPPATVDGSAAAVGEVALPEYQFRTRRQGDPQKVFSWAEATVDLDGVVGDVVLDVDLRNCPNDTDARLVSPTGTMVLLWSEKGNTRTWDEVQGAFPDTLESLESLCALRGEEARGVWRLRVGDTQESCSALLRRGRLVFQPPGRPCGEGGN
jgi:hypothetical protein